MERAVRIRSVKPRENFSVELEFSDGTIREIDLGPFLRGRIFDSIRNDKAIFRSVMVDEQSGTICWENGADIDPDVLYFGLNPARAEGDASVSK